MTIVPEFERQLFAVADSVLPVPAEGESPPATRRRRRGSSGASRFRHGSRLAVSGSATVAAAGTIAAAAAAAGLFSAATGIHVNAGDPNARAIGTGESLRLGAADEVSVGEKLTREIRFAPGYASWRAGTIAFQTSLGRGSPPAGQAFMTSSALRFQVAESAACSWLSYYVASEAAGNTAAATSAAAQVRAAPSWPAITGFNYPNELNQAVAAVDAGDPKLVQALIDTGQAGNCTAFGPFRPAGMSIADSRAKLAADNQLGQQEIATDRVAHWLGISGS